MPLSADGSDELRRVRRALAVLSPLEREILGLSAGRGLPNGEIAARLGMPGRRVERVLARALSKFDRAMHEPARSTPRLGRG